MGLSLSADRRGARRPLGPFWRRSELPGANAAPPRVLTVGSTSIQYRQTPRGQVVFYVDPPQQEALASELREAVTVRNFTNLLKHTLSLVPIDGDGSRCYISFRTDNAVVAECTIYYAVQECWERQQGLHYAPQDASLGGCPGSVSILPAETDHLFVSEAPLDLEMYEKYLMFDGAELFLVPIVIAMKCEVPATKSKASNPKKQWQFTYCQVVNIDGQRQLKCIKQRLQLDDFSLFDLDDVYGSGDQEGKPPVVDDAVCSGAEAGGDQCVICLANERDTTVMPCRHMCLCGDCADVLRRQTNRCPICRTSIECLAVWKKAGPPLPGAVG